MKALGPPFEDKFVVRKKAPDEGFDYIACMFTGRKWQGYRQRHRPRRVQPPRIVVKDEPVSAVSLDLPHRLTVEKDVKPLIHHGRRPRARSMRTSMSISRASLWPAETGLLEGRPDRRSGTISIPRFSALIVLSRRPISARGLPCSISTIHCRLTPTRLASSC